MKYKVLKQITTSMTRQMSNYHIFQYIISLEPKESKMKNIKWKPASLQ